MFLTFGAARNCLKIHFRTEDSIFSLYKYIHSFAVLWLFYTTNYCALFSCHCDLGLGDHVEQNLRIDVDVGIDLEGYQKGTRDSVGAEG